MIFGALIALCALIFFAALNLVAAGAFALGFILLVTLWLRRKSEFWPLLFAMIPLFGGAGALGVSYGGYFAVANRTPDWGYAVLAWIVGYALGAILGALLGLFSVALRRRTELPLIENQLKTRFNTLKTRWKRLGFCQTLRIGAYSLRVAFSKR